MALVGLLLLLVELRRSKAEGRVGIALTGLLASALALGALLRPVTVVARGTRVGAKVVVLVDQSRSMLLPGAEGARDETARKAVERLQKSAGEARLTFLGFGEKVEPLPPGGARPRAQRSDLLGALRSVLVQADEMPQALVVVSDGRLEGPGPEQIGEALRGLLPGKGVPVHAVAVAEREPKDASVRAVRTAGAAVAHQPVSMTVEVGCSGGLSCDSLPVAVRELLDGAPPALLSSGVARVVDGKATLELQMTLDRAGPRLVEVAIDAPEGDTIPENNRRTLAFDVSRERVRLLHVAGRPTYDVRALRNWLKSNASVDVIAFFILRTERSDVHASDSELALIRFPVEELFTEQLPSFDAVVLQDFNAEPYRLLRYIPNLARYVEGGGGFVMVGGPEAFLGGRYQGTDLERVLPVDLKQATSGDTTFDLAPVVPRITEAGQAAPMLAPLRSLFGNDLPSMPGVNLVGDPKPGSLVLWEHPSRKTRSGRPMPLLSLGEFGDGRSVAIALDGVHRLGFSEFAERVAGRGHGALWDGLLGWLMRDPRFEPAQIELPQGCAAGEPTTLRVTPLPGTSGTLSLEIFPANERKGPPAFRGEAPSTGKPVDLPIGALAPGGYMARVKIGAGSGARRAFACEVGGDEWADPRPDRARLGAIASSTGGRLVDASDASKLTFPQALEINAERSVTPLLPPWFWTFGAALLLGVHWLFRRRGGLV